MTNKFKYIHPVQDVTLVPIFRLHTPHQFKYIHPVQDVTADVRLSNPLIDI